MSDYMITPDKKEIPSSYLLSEEMHRRALTVEMEVRGTNYKWESIYFYDPVAPENQCFVERNLHSMVYKISLATASTHEAEEMQNALVEIILHEVGGKVYDPGSGESYDLKGFRGRSEDSSAEFEFEKKSIFKFAKPIKTTLPFKEILWTVFSWVFVLWGVYVYQSIAQPRKIFVLIACLLALISAGGITFFNFKTNKPK